MSARVGVILAGCGYLDGSEIHEATLTLLHLAKAGAQVTCLAPDIDEGKVIDHRTGDVQENDHRNVLAESARIARGDVHPMYDYTADDFDALIVPGGFGAAKNLSDFAYHENMDNVACEIHVNKLVNEMFAAKKPMGFLCIAPASVAAVALRDKGITLTVGNDPNAAMGIIGLGNRHEEAGVSDIVIDDAHNIISTPAYMLAQNIAEADSGIEKLITEVLRRC